MTADVEHQHRCDGRDHPDLFQRVLESRVVAEFGEDFLPGGLEHGGGDVIIWLIDERSVAPQGVEVLGLAGEVRLMRHHDRYQPTRVLQRQQRAGARQVPGELLDPVQEQRAPHGEGERLPPGLVDIAMKHRGLT